MVGILVQQPKQCVKTSKYPIGVRRLLISFPLPFAVTHLQLKVSLMGKHLVIQFIMDIIVTINPKFMRHLFRKHPVVVDQLQLTVPFQCNPRRSFVVLWSLAHLVDREDLFSCARLNCNGKSRLAPFQKAQQPLKSKFGWNCASSFFRFLIVRYLISLS